MVMTMCKMVLVTTMTFLKYICMYFYVLFIIISVDQLCHFFVQCRFQFFYFLTQHICPHCFWRKEQITVRYNTSLVCYSNTRRLHNSINFDCSHCCAGLVPSVRKHWAINHICMFCPSCYQHTVLIHSKSMFSVMYCSV